jgi:hypothetical protein
MENNNFNLLVSNFYKDINEPIINKIITNNSFKNILELSTLSEIPIIKKEKNNWYLIDKPIVLKNITTLQKKKIKEIKKNLSKIDIIKINDIKNSNNKLFSDLESIDLLKDNIINDNIYDNLKKLSLLSSNIELKKKYKKDKKDKKNIEKTVKSNIPLNNIFISSETEDYIEVFTN